MCARAPLLIPCSTAEVTSDRDARARRMSPESLALGKAAELAREVLERGDLVEMSAMRDRIEQKILAKSKLQA